MKCFLGEKIDCLRYASEHGVDREDVQFVVQLAELLRMIEGRSHARYSHPRTEVSWHFRRSVLKAGFLGLTGLSCADLLRLRPGRHGATRLSS